MAINVTTSQQQITASVAEDKISANVSAGFGATGPQGPSGVITVTAPITNSGTTTAANVGLSVGSGLAVSGGSLVLGTHTHDDRYYTETEVDSLLSGYATLVGGKVPSSQLPSYVDDVIEVATYGDLPSPGESGKIYLVIGTNKVYRWTGFVWLEIVASPGSTDSLAEGSVNLYHTTQRAANAAPVQSVAGKTGAVVLAAGDIASGTLSASRLPLASSGTRGAVRIGSGISIDGDGVISVSTNYAASSHTHNASEVSYEPLGVITSATDVQAALEDVENAIETRVGAGQYATTNDWGIVKIGSGVSVLDGVISVSTNYAAASHTHGSITNSGAIGTTSGLIVTTGASGVLGTLAMGTAGQVLKINSGATGVEWGSAAADVSIDTTAADILSASSGSITADDPGADRLVFWDDSAGKLTHLTAGTGLSISGTTITASVSASDISAGTLAYARMADPTVTSPSQITASQNDYSGFARGINRFSTNGAYNLTGMAAGNDGEVRVLTNVGTTAANTLTIKDESSSSTASNRFYVPWNGDCVIPAEGSVVVFYDVTSSRWRVV